MDWIDTFSVLLLVLSKGHTNEITRIVSFFCLHSFHVRGQVNQTHFLPSQDLSVRSALYGDYIVEVFQANLFGEASRGI
jgi:hypothetical protein